MKRRNGVLLALLVGFALLSWWLALDSPNSGDDTLAAAEDLPPPAAAPSRRAENPADPARPASQPAPAPAAPPHPPAAAPNAPRPAAEQAPIPPDTRGFVDALQARFDADPRDANASQTETDIRKLYRAPRMPDGILRSVVCRQSVCRLDLHWSADNDEAYRDVLDYLANDNAKFIATRARPQDKYGTVEVEAYWIRRPLSD
jgi:hypothetical protein